MQGTIIFKF